MKAAIVILVIGGSVIALTILVALAGVLAHIAWLVVQRLW